jgi:hypothetical protein
MRQETQTVSKDREPNYLTKLRRMIRRGELPVNPGLRNIEIRHEPDCAHHSGLPCSCDPEVVLLGEDCPAGDN